MWNVECGMISYLSWGLTDCRLLLFLYTIRYTQLGTHTQNCMDRNRFYVSSLVLYRYVCYRLYDNSRMNQSHCNFFREWGRTILTSDDEHQYSRKHESEPLKWYRVLGVGGDGVGVGVTFTSRSRGFLNIEGLELERVIPAFHFQLRSGFTYYEAYVFIP